MTVDLLIIGGSGFIGGRTAQAALRSGFTVACTTRSRPAPDGAVSFALDVHDADALVDCLQRCRPRTVIYSVLSWDLNSQAAQMRDSAEGVRALIRALRHTGSSARLVYISTNAVFSGRQGPYSEDTPPDAEIRTDAYRFYGLARRAGEIIALEEWPDTIIARTANVDGRDARGQINKRLLALVEPLRAGQPLPRYVDRILTPTLVDDLAVALVEVSAPGFLRPPGGILHLAGGEQVSDFQYAVRLAHYLGCDPALVREDHYLAPEVEGIYNIALDIQSSQRRLQTRFGGLNELFQTIFRDKPN